MGKEQHLRIFFKGMAMGLADIVPGVSGGTVALILDLFKLNQIAEAAGMERLKV